MHFAAANGVAPRFVLYALQVWEAQKAWQREQEAAQKPEAVQKVRHPAARVAAHANGATNLLHIR